MALRTLERVSQAANRAFNGRLNHSADPTRVFEAAESVGVRQEAERALGGVVPSYQYRLAATPRVQHRNPLCTEYSFPHGIVVLVGTCHQLLTSR